MFSLFELWMIPESEPILVCAQRINQYLPFYYQLVIININFPLVRKVK